MDEDDLDKIRQMRELKMKNEALKMQRWRAKGKMSFCFVVWPLGRLGRIS